MVMVSMIYVVAMMMNTLVMLNSDDDDGINGARHVEGLVKINLGLFKFSPALD